MSEQQIKIRRRLSAFTLLAIWVMVFAMPALIVYLSIDYLMNLSLIAGKRAATGSMTSEMDTFRRDLEIPAFLQRRLEKHFADLGQVPDWNDPARAMADLASGTGLQPAALITHSADTLEVSYHLQGVIASEIKNLPRSLMRRYLVLLNQQLTRSFHQPEAEASTRAAFRFIDQSKARKDADMFFRRSFSLITEIPLISQRVIKSISSRLGGILYFYYHPFVSIEDGKELIRGGQLLIFCGADLNAKEVARDAAKIASTGLRRSYTAFDHSLLGSDNNLQEIITRFYEDEAGYHFVSSMSQSSIVDLVQQGTLVPHRLKQVASRMPLLKVSVPWSELQHTWRSYLNLFILAVRLYVLFGSVLLLRFFFYGIEFRAGIAAKVVFGTAFVLLLPVVLLMVGFTTWQQFYGVYGWYNAEIRQQQFFAQFSAGFSSYLNSLQSQAFAVAQAAKKQCLQKNAAELEKVLTAGLEETVASDLMLDRRGQKTIRIVAKNRRSHILPEEESARRLSASAVLNAFDENDRFNEIYNDGREKNITSVDASFINEMISRWGRPYRLFRFNVANRYSSVYIHEPGKNNPMAILSLIFNNETLLRDFVSRYHADPGAPGSFSRQYYLIRPDAGVLRFYDLFSDKEASDPELVGLLNMAVNSGQRAQRINNRDLMQIFSMSEFPLLVVTRSNNVAGQYDNRFFMAMLIAYALLLLIFVFLVFKLIYLRPIDEFIRVTEAVAAGDYEQQVELSQTDEFGDLKNSFDEMIQGLEQRRRLSHFVSQEVIKAVESDAKDSMAVGGERIEASVAFIQLEKLEHLPEDATAEQIFALLSDFIAAADVSASRHGGVVDKLVEDTLMLVFRGSADRRDHAVSACAAVLELEQKMRSLDLRIYAGIASGPVVSGRIGSRLGKLDLTVIGDTVNLAARLKGQAKKAASTGIIISPGTIRILKGLARVSFIERTEIKGKSREYPLYELTSLRS